YTAAAFFFLSGYGDRRVLHSFPTRRSSDLVLGGCAGAADDAAVADGSMGLSALPRGHRAALAALRQAGACHLGRTDRGELGGRRDRKSTRLNSSHLVISYAVFCLKKKKKNN